MWWGGLLYEMADTITKGFREMAWEAVDWIVVTQEQQLKQAFMITVMNNTWGSMNTAKFQPAAVEQKKTL
jgi:hypothetical protein